MESLSDKLKALGLQVGAKDLPKPAERRKRGIPIEDVLSGYDDSTPFGQTFIVEQTYDQAYRHGQIDLCDFFDSRVLHEWCRTELNASAANNGSYLYLDTETSGLSGGTGTYAFLIGLGFKQDDSFKVVQLFLRDPALEPALLASLARWVESFDTVVTFNGRGFDIPLLNTRHVLNAIPTPFTARPHIDLLPVARKLWRSRLPSRALKDLEVQILNLERSSEEVPGWLVPQLYFDYLHTHDARPLYGVFYHNQMDILSLAALMNVVSGMLSNPLHLDDLDSLDVMSIARLYEDMGNFDNAAALYERSLEQGLPHAFFRETLLRYARMYRRQDHWESAIRLWEKAAEHHVVEGCIELSKFFEHRERKPSDALYWAQLAQECLSKADYLTRSMRYDLKQDTERRLNRLARKISRHAADEDPVDLPPE
jgi:uncharacterized protein YprB with RNaseH-like and TPR domain